MDISRFDQTFLARTLQKRGEAGDLGADQSLEESLTISYSEFFRNPLTYATLEKIVLPSLAARARGSSRKELRFWSSACAGGQEAYTLAILMEELGNRGLSDLKYRIFATDLSAPQVERANVGWYSATEVKNLSVRRLGDWLVGQDGGYQVVPLLREKIEFSTFDFFDETHGSPPGSIFGDFDLILCANVLFYYNDESRATILKKLGRALTAEGFLITDEVERSLMKGHGWQEVYHQTAIFRPNQHQWRQQ